MTTTKLPVIEMLLTGLSINRQCWETIEKVYNERPSEYYERYLNTEYRNISLKRIFTMESEEKFNQLVGIVHYSEEKGDLLLIERIIRAVYPPLVNYVKKSSKVDLVRFQIQYELEERTEEEIFTYFACLIYLSSKRNKEVGDIEQIGYALKKFMRYVGVAKMNENIGESKEEYDKGYVTLGESLFTTYNMEKLKKEDLTVGEFISSEIEFQTLRSLGVEDYWNMKRLYDESITSEIYHEARSQQFQSGINRYVGCFARYLGRLGMDSHDILAGIKLTKEGLDLIFDDFGKSVRGNGVNEKEMELYTASWLFIYALVQQYNRAREDYLDTKTEKQYFELKTLETSLKEEQSKLKQIKDKQEERVKTQQEELEELRKKVKRLEAENKQLGATVDKNELQLKSFETQQNEMSESIQDLKTQLAETQNRLSNQSPVSLNEKIAFLNDYHIGMFGGRQNIRELSNMLENISFYDALNEDLTSIQGLDVVFINTDYMNHAFTAKIRSVSDKLGVPTRYIGGVNRELLIGTMFEELQSFKK